MAYIEPIHLVKFLVSRKIISLKVFTTSLISYLSLLTYCAITFSTPSSANVNETRSSKMSSSVTLHSLPIKPTFKGEENLSENLIPVPKPNIRHTSLQVSSLRNPFSESESLNFGGYNQLMNSIRFTGIVKTSTNLAVLIRTKIGQKAYEVGDEVGKSYKVSSISTVDQTLVLTNGIREFTLSLEK